MSVLSLNVYFTFPKPNSVLCLQKAFKSEPVLSLLEQKCFKIELFDFYTDYENKILNTAGDFYKTKNLSAKV